MNTEIIIFMAIIAFGAVVFYAINCHWRKQADTALTKVQSGEPASHKIAIQEPIGFLYMHQIKLMIDVYEPIGWFKRLMLRWCLGLEYYSDRNDRGQVPGIQKK